MEILARNDDQERRRLVANFDVLGFNQNVRRGDIRLLASRLWQLGPAVCRFTDFRDRDYSGDGIPPSHRVGKIVKPCLTRIPLDHLDNRDRCRRRTRRRFYELRRAGQWITEILK